MRQNLLCITFFLVFASPLYAQTATGISASYHDGQIFLTWTNIPNVDTGFYYVYKSGSKITNANIQNATYLGRVPYNFGYDYRLSTCLPGKPDTYLMTNDNPVTVLNPDQNLFVMNCTKNNEITFFAVRCDYGYTTPNWTVVPGGNSTMFGAKQHLDPIRCYLRQTLDPCNDKNEAMDIYIHYGGNVAVGTYPEMSNEACLPFHFGIIKTGPVGGNNNCQIKFHAGGGHFIESIEAKLDNTWKVSFDDFLPSFNFSDDGTNSKWLGYHEGLDIYKFADNDDPPTSGLIKAYTFFRNEWELDWILTTWPGTIDPTKISLSGSSQGCSGVLLHCLVYPEKYAAGSVTDPKFNLDAPEDHNPDCKYNEFHSGKTSVNILWGNEDVVNLYTDIPKKPGGSVFYKVYDLTNMNDMYNSQKNKSFPFIMAISGKNDENTCWEEKPPFYKTVQDKQAGGIYYWDLRGHGGGSNAWPPIKPEYLGRYSSTKSYPAFSNCALDGDPGSVSNPSPPYFSGDDTGSIHGNIDWIDSTVIDQPDAWEAKMFIFQAKLNAGNVYPPLMPNYAKTDVSIRRAQNFKGFSPGVLFCWYAIHNGDTIQSGTTTQKYQGTEAKPITIKKVKVYPDGTVLRIVLCSAKQGNTSDLPVAAVESFSAYPNPFSEQFTVDFVAPGNSDVMIEVFDLLGERMFSKSILNATEGKHTYQFNTSSLVSGTYLVKITSGDEHQTLKLVKD